jgi:fatty-acyl-CoA synthase
MKHPIYLKKLARPIGVSAGARVACSLPNGIDYLAAIIGCARLGALAVHINTRFRGRGRQSPAPAQARPALVAEWGFAPVDFPAIFAALTADDRATLRCVRLPIFHQIGWTK